MTNAGPGEGHSPVDPEREIGADLHDAARAALGDALSREPGRVLSVLIRALRDFDLAEDALQDAVTVALERWPADGVPENPAGWLVTTARRRAIDRLRRSASWQRNEDELRVAVDTYKERLRTSPDLQKRGLAALDDANAATVRASAPSNSVRRPMRSTQHAAHSVNSVD